MTSVVVQPVGGNNAGPVVLGLRQGQNLDVESPTFDYRLGEDSLRNFAATGLKAALRVPHAANRNQLNDEIPRAPNQPLVPGLGNRLLRLGGIFGIARRDHEI